MSTSLTKKVVETVARAASPTLSRTATLVVNNNISEPAHKRLKRDHTSATSILAGEETQLALQSIGTNVFIDEQPSQTLVEAQSSTADISTDTKTKGKRGRAKKGSPPQVSPTDFPPRSDLEWKIGAHVSAAGGVEESIINGAKIGADAFALFLKSQRKWSSKGLTDDNISNFKSRLFKFGFQQQYILPHGSYLVNLGNPDKEKREKSYDCFIDDLKRCEQLGLTLYNFHPGSTVGACTPEESMAHISASLNRAHKATKNVVTVVENMAGAGNVLGCKFEQLAKIIEGVEDKSRVGVCLDTCHLFASGYDIRTKGAYDATMAKFDEVVGFSYLRGLHLNDSKEGLDSKRDRHEHLGLGKIGIRAFSFFMRDPRMKSLPMILETETEEVWPKEIEVLQRMGRGEENFEEMVAEIKELVKKHGKAMKEKASKAQSGGGGSKGNKAAGGRKRKRTDEDDECGSE